MKFLVSFWSGGSLEDTADSHIQSTLQYQAVPSARRWPSPRRRPPSWRRRPAASVRRPPTSVERANTTGRARAGSSSSFPTARPWLGIWPGTGARRGLGPTTFASFLVTWSFSLLSCWAWSWAWAGTIFSEMSKNTEDVEPCHGWRIENYDSIFGFPSFSTEKIIRADMPKKIIHLGYHAFLLTLIT